MSRFAGFIVAAAASHSGKTTVALGLIAALKARRLNVSAAKCGPDYIDPRFLEAASGAPAINLDPWAMAPEMLTARLRKHAAEADILVVEGAMGLYDGGPGGAGSTASLAALSGLPVLLVVGAQSLAQSAAALTEGCARFANRFVVAGAIANRVASEHHADLIREGFARASVPLLGLVRSDPAVEFASRHLGLVQAEEHDDLARKIVRAGELVAEGCDVAQIVEIARPQARAPFSHREKVAAKRPDEGLPSTEKLRPPVPAATQPELADAGTPSPVGFADTLSLWERGRAQSLSPLGQRVAVARDVAFAFAYPHLLADWREAGAEVSFFSPLDDEAPLHDADAVYLPGGYPELHAGRIAASEKFRAGMHGAAERGALIYGECGGYMVLGENLVDAEGNSHRMLGLLSVSTSFERRKLHLGYRRLAPLSELPWPTPLTAHEFHYASIVSEGDGERLFEAADAGGVPLGKIGLRRGRVMGSFAHVIDAA